jgi:hypothetical protein
LSRKAVARRKADAAQGGIAYISSQHLTEITMTTRTLPKLFALTLAAAISATGLSTVVTGMQSQPTPALYSIELPTVVIVAHKASEPQATAQAQATPGKNG